MLEVPEYNSIPVTIRSLERLPNSKDLGGIRNILRWFLYQHSSWVTDTGHVGGYRPSDNNIWTKAADSFRALKLIFLLLELALPVLFLFVYLPLSLAFVVSVLLFIPHIADLNATSYSLLFPVYIFKVSVMKICLYKSIKSSLILSLGRSFPFVIYVFIMIQNHPIRAILH